MLAGWKNDERCVEGAARPWVVSISVLTTYAFTPHWSPNLTSSGHRRLKYTCVFKCLMWALKLTYRTYPYYIIIRVAEALYWVFPWRSQVVGQTIVLVCMEFICLPTLLAHSFFISNLSLQTQVTWSQPGWKRMSDFPHLSSPSSPITVTWLLLNK